MSPVLVCAPYFAEEKLHKSYAECTLTKRAKVHKAAADHVKACLFLLVSHNPPGGTNAEMTKEMHNQFLGNQVTYPTDISQDLRRVTDYRSSTTPMVANGSAFSITGTAGTSIVCRLCGKPGYKSPDCPNPSCKAYYDDKRTNRNKPKPEE